MILKSLTLKNIRSYRRLKLKFHPGFNAIIGEGMSGKSNIIRAVRYLCYLRPVGSKYRFKSASPREDSKIILRTSEGNTISLIKNKDPKYIIQNKGDKKEFRKFGTTPPKEIVKILNLNNINFQFQFDGSYVVSEKPMQLTRTINRITKINLVDNWIKDINKQIKIQNDYLYKTQGELEDIEEQLNALSDLGELNRIISKIKTLNKVKTKKEEKYFKLSSIIADMDAAEEKLESLKKREKLIDTDLLSEMELVQNQKEELDQKLYYVQEYINAKRKISKLKKKYAEKLKHFISILKKSGKCPTCVSPIGWKVIERIEDEYRLSK